MAQGPEFSLLREADQIVYTHNAELTKDQIGGVYSRLKDAVAMVGITPETAQHQHSVDPMFAPKPYHFLDLPGVFFIRYHGKDLLEVRRVQDLTSGGYIHEDFHINPKGNITYYLATTDSRDFDHAWHIKEGFVSLGAPENKEEVFNRSNDLTDKLYETITREGHQTQDIEQETRELFPLLMRTFRQRRNLTIAHIGPVQAWFGGRVRTNDRIVTVLERQSNDLMEVHEDGQGMVYSDEGHAHIYNKGAELELRDPHFLLMKVRELRSALEQAA